MSRALLPALMIALASCSAALKGEDTDDTSGQGPGSDGGGGSGSGGDGGEQALDELPDLRSDLDLAGCQEVESSDGEMLPVPGAVSYFYGEYYQTTDGDGWAGEERWLLFANERWKELGGADCEVVWSMTATLVGEVEAGGQVEMNVTADIRGSETTCPEGLYEGDETWSANYSVEISDDMRSSWFFSGAEPFATGGSTAVAMNFLSEKACAWF